MDSQETTPTVNIKDYLLAKKPDEHIQATSPYQVILQTSCDFIISRKKGRVEKELVILVSEDLFYFKEKEKIENVTPEKLQTFLRDLRGFYITLEQVLWMPTLSKDSINHLIDIISNPTYLAMARANVLTKDGYNAYDNWSANHWEKNSQLFEEVHVATRDIHSRYYRTCMDAAYEIETRFGYIEALYFVEMLKKSSFNQFTFDYNRYSYQYLEKNNMRGFFQLLDEPYNLELRALIDYTFIDSYAQGITKITVEFWQTYESYLKMQIQIFGEVRDKYPRYLMTAHDVTALNIGLLENMPSDDSFKELTTEVRSLAHEDKEYSIVVPATARQIAEEGIVLNHCLGANAGQIASGDLYILFLRNSDAKEQPLVTLRYNNDKITGAEGLHRRGLTTNERKFLEHWGKEKDVQIAA